MRRCGQEIRRRVPKRESNTLKQQQALTNKVNLTAQKEMGERRKGESFGGKEGKKLVGEKNRFGIKGWRIEHRLANKEKKKGYGVDRGNGARHLTPH